MRGKRKGKDAVIALSSHSSCHLIGCTRARASKDEGDGRFDGGKTGSGGDGWYDNDGLVLTSAGSRVSGVVWLWCELIE